MSNVIVSCGVSGWYPKGVERLEQSLKDVAWQGEVLTWKEEYPPGSPPHAENPYAFKLFAFEEAQRQGYRNVLWCDSSVWAVKNPEPIFSIIQEQGYYLWDSGYFCDCWINDRTLDAFALTREIAHDIPMISANIMGFDIQHPLALKFMARYRWAYEQGLFIGPWTKQPVDPERPPYMGHRHDQSSASLIAHELGMTLEMWGINCQYYERANLSRMSPAICLTLEGM